MRFIVLPAARRDILQQYTHYVEQDVQAVADRFVQAVNESVDILMAMPEAGAPRATGNPQLAGLRTWPVRGFEEIRMYYLMLGDVLQIVRVLHGRRDIGTILESQDVDDPRVH